MKQTDRKRLDAAYKKLRRLKTTFLGYPCDAEFNYEPLYRFLSFPINNVGDPFEQSNYQLQTKSFEREVLRFFSKLFHIKDYWGYITNGGTEGNLYGLYAAREQFPKARVFFSEHTHYSIKKNVHLLGMKYTSVKAQKNGEIDYADFEKKVSKQKQAIVVANIGSTLTGAIDNSSKLHRILKKHGVERYIHADAALYGMVLPFISDILFDFRVPIKSIVVSGHKFMGSPIPCGVVLTRKSVANTLQNYIEYVGAHDTTLSGSRDAFTPLIMWYRIKCIGIRGFRKQVAYSCDLAQYLVKKLRRMGWKDVHSSYITVSFKRPSERVVKKWELAVQGDIAHAICLPHDTKKQLDLFIKELEEECNEAP